jgi:hypothetical protein
VLVDLQTPPHLRQAKAYGLLIEDDALHDRTLSARILSRFLARLGQRVVATPAARRNAAHGLLGGLSSDRRW